MIPPAYPPGNRLAPGMTQANLGGEPGPWGRVIKRQARLKE